MKTIILILSLIFYTSLAQSQSKEIAKKTTDNYAISYDNKYFLNDSGTNGSSFYIFLTEKPDSTNLRANINLVEQELTGKDFNLDKFLALTEKQIKQYGTILHSERKKKNDRFYQEILFTLNLQGKNVKFLQYDYVVGNKAYVLTYTASEGSFEKSKQAAEEIMDTFTILTPPAITHLKQ